MKKLRYFNGRCPVDIRGHSHACICAYSKAQAVRLAQEAFGQHSFSIKELNTYWAECWGVPAQQALGEQTEPGVFIGIQGHFFKFVGNASENF